MPTPRGSGVGIVTALILSGFIITGEYAFAALCGAVGAAGLLEDRFALPPRARLFVQLIISAATVTVFLGPPVSVLSAALFIFWIVFMAGTANIYNFMDGINGMAGLSGLSAFGLMAAYSYFIAGDTAAALISVSLSAACAGFLPFNFPKARVFMGDAGALFLGFVFSAMIMRLSQTGAVFITLSMFLCLFYSDALLTIFYRWRKGEALMKAHRSHLYQRLSNEMTLPHWAVSTAYAAAQLLFGLLSLLAYGRGRVWLLTVVIFFAAAFIALYMAIKAVAPAQLNGRDIAV